MFQTSNSEFRSSVVVLAACAVLLAATGCGSGRRTPAGPSMRFSALDSVTPGAVPNALSRTEKGWRVSSGLQWGYAAYVPLPAVGDRVNGTVETRFQVRQGQFTAGLLTSDNRILEEKTFPAADSDQAATFSLASGAQSVVFRSAAPQGAVTEALVQGVDYVLYATPLPAAASLQQIVKGDPAAVVVPGPPVHVITGQKYGYAASVPLKLAADEPALLRVRGRVIRGRVGVGILNKAGTAVVPEHYYDQASATADYLTFIVTPKDAGQILFRSDRDEKSEMVIEEIAVYRLK